MGRCVEKQASKSAQCPRAPTRRAQVRLLRARGAGRCEHSAGLARVCWRRRLPGLSRASWTGVYAS